jgi:hypothetical protein
MNPWPGRRPLAIVTACLNAAGIPDLAVTEVAVTYAEYADGVHCEQVEAQLVAADYEEPFLHFDEGPAAQALLPAVQQYLATALLVPDRTCV